MEVFDWFTPILLTQWTRRSNTAFLNIDNLIIPHALEFLAAVAIDPHSWMTSLNSASEEARSNNWRMVCEKWDQK